MNVAPKRFSTATRQLLEDGATELFLSAASAWEIAIKHAVGKLPLPAPPGDYVVRRLRDTGTSALPITHVHALRVALLPRHHRDPFDRLLIAQAQIEDLTIMTADPQFDAYDVQLIAP